MERWTGLRRDEGVDESAALLSGCANDEDAPKTGHCQIRESVLMRQYGLGRHGPFCFLVSDLGDYCDGKISDELTQR